VTNPGSIEAKLSIPCSRESAKFSPRVELFPVLLCLTDVGSDLRAPYLPVGDLRASYLCVGNLRVSDPRAGDPCAGDPRA
jgi:hypothetical protein